MSNRQKKFIRPAEGRSCPKPDGTPLAEGGEELAVTPYWRRRERDGDVIITARAPRKSSAQKKED